MPDMMTLTHERESDMTDNKDAAAIAARIRTCIREGEPYETVVQVATQAAEALERRAADVRRQALEEAAALAEMDVDWSGFGKRDLQPWPTGPDDVRDYRLGIVAGRTIAAAIRAIAGKSATGGGA